MLYKNYFTVIFISNVLVDVNRIYSFILFYNFTACLEKKEEDWLLPTIVEKSKIKSKPQDCSEKGNDPPGPTVISKRQKVIKPVSIWTFKTTLNLVESVEVKVNSFFFCVYEHCLRPTVLSFKIIFIMSLLII